MRSAPKLYKTTVWKKTRELYMKSKFGECERCGGIARIVHHKVHLTPENYSDPSIALDWNNLEALCTDCHNAEHFQTGTACADGLRFDENGNLVKI